MTDSDDDFDIDDDYSPAWISMKPQPADVAGIAAELGEELRRRGIDPLVTIKYHYLGCMGDSWTISGPKKPRLSGCGKTLDEAVKEFVARIAKQKQRRLPLPAPSIGDE